MRCYADAAQVTRTPLKLWLKKCNAEDPEQRWFFTQYEVNVTVNVMICTMGWFA